MELAEAIINSYLHFHANHWESNWEDSVPVAITMELYKLIRAYFNPKWNFNGYNEKVEFVIIIKYYFNHVQIVIIKLLSAVFCGIKYPCNCIDNAENVANYKFNIIIITVFCCIAIGVATHEIGGLVDNEADEYTTIMYVALVTVYDCWWSATAATR